MGPITKGVATQGSEVTTPFNILLVNQDEKLVQTIESACAASDLRLAIITDLSQAPAADCILLDSRTQAKVFQSVLSAHAEKTILLSHKDDKQNINEILAKYPLHHLIGVNGKSPAEEIMITLRKVLTGDIWGVDKYFGAQATKMQASISNAAQINPEIERLLLQLDLGDYFAATHEILRMTINEFVTNAVYNAPVDENNEPKYEHVDRRNKIQLDQEETVDIVAMADADKVAFSVSDHFGRLTQEKIVQHFVKCVNNVNFIEEKKGGAGAGVYLSFYMSNQYIVNIDPGKKLEAICILERNKSYKSYRTRITSFNYFKRGSAA